MTDSMEQGTFTKRLWKSISNIYKEIREGPFVNGLASGTLPQRSFAHYVSQDILYVKDDTIALEKLAARAENAEEKDFFQRMAREGYEIEREMHSNLLEYFHIEKAQEKSPAIEAYGAFLHGHVEHSDYPVAAAALLPCFWVYQMIGQEITSKSNRNNPYQKWIDTYSSDIFEAALDEFLQIIETHASHSDNVRRDKMKDAFIEATKQELRFFQESWVASRL